MLGAEHASLRLVVNDVCVRVGRGGPPIVDQVAFEVRAGEVLGLVGESGSGKTTVALALLGYAKRGTSIASGTVVIDGVDLLSLSADELRRARGAKVAYVPQDPSSALNPALRVGTQLSEALAAHPASVESPNARIDELLSEVSLPLNHLRRYPHQLSGGQQQRIALAMAFACRPSLVVLDEPTTGLDVTTQRRVLKTVRELSTAYRVAAVYVSHDLAVVSELAASVAVMYAGRVVEFGPAAQVFGAPLHPYTQALCVAVPSAERSQTLVGLEGRPPRPGRRPEGCSFAPRCRYAVSECLEAEPEAQIIDERLIRCIRAGTDRTAHHPIGRGAIRLGVSREAYMLRTQNLDAWYSDVSVLRGVSLDVPAESCVAIVGESGSGKTTLARCIIGLHQHYSGTITFEGAELPHLAKERTPDLRRRMRYIFQNPYGSLNPRKSVRQLIEQPLAHFHRVSRSEREARISAALADVALASDIQESYPDELSGGERQRVAIARALVVDPSLLVCDEVTSSLDVSVQALVIELLRRLQAERHLTLIFITHNLALVRSLADTVVVLADGRIVEAGETDAVMDTPQDAYTARLMNDIPKSPVGPAHGGRGGLPGIVSYT